MIKERKLKVAEVIDEVREIVNQHDSKAKIISAVSGGIDSTVASAIVAKALGKRFIPVHCHNGLMRIGTRQEVEYIFQDVLKTKPVIINCQKEFLSKLKGITDPEKKENY